LFNIKSDVERWLGQPIEILGKPDRWAAGERGKGCRLRGEYACSAGVQTLNTGRHHLTIDTQLSPEQMKEPIPVDTQHRHFGGGQTEVALTLPAGQHTLQLVLGDFAHIPHNPPVVSAPINITVK
jgi:hypothetical protein